MTFDADVLRRTALDKFPFDAGKFFGSAEGLSLGAGVIYDGIEYPLYDASCDEYNIASGLVYVLTHECDASQENEREFNDLVLICPVLDFVRWGQFFCSKRNVGALMGLAPKIVEGEVHRVIFLPMNSYLPNGGLLYLNQISHAPVSGFSKEGARAVCALSQYGATRVDKKIENHLLRPKTEILPKLG